MPTGAQRAASAARKAKAPVAQSSSARVQPTSKPTRRPQESEAPAENAMRLMGRTPLSAANFRSESGMAAIDMVEGVAIVGGVGGAVGMAGLPSIRPEIPLLPIKKQK